MKATMLAICLMLVAPVTWADDSAMVKEMDLMFRIREIRRQTGTAAWDRANVAVKKTHFWRIKEATPFLSPRGAVLTSDQGAIVSYFAQMLYERELARRLKELAGELQDTVHSDIIRRHSKTVTMSPIPPMPR